VSAALQPRQPVRASPSLAAIADRKVLDLYAPPGVIINEDCDVLHFRGRVGPYLHPAAGSASFNLMRLARPELHVDLRRIIRQAFDEDHLVAVDSKFRDGANLTVIHLEAIPVAEPDSNTRCLLILFQEAAERDAERSHEPIVPSQDVRLEQRIVDLERDLLSTKEYLQTTIEELESANEELQSSNEELQSSNEELQSTNEELETSREELQSSNEELTTVNDELQLRMVEQQHMAEDLQNALAGAGEIVVITDPDLRIRRYTPAAEHFFDLSAEDLHSPLKGLGRRLGDMAVESLAQEAIRERQPIFRAINDMVVKIAPYSTSDRVFAGVVLAIRVGEPLPGHRTSTTPARVAEVRAILDMVREPMVVVDRALCVVWANQVFVADHDGIGGLVGVPLERLAPTGTVLVELELAIRRALEHGLAFDAMDLGPWRVSGTALPQRGGDEPLVLLAFADDRA
jgi:two-component system CheB/CheR fusion protein